MSKYFLTVGDWTSKVWIEDLKTPLITTKYNDVLLTDGAWSPNKPGLFFLTRSDGWLDAWDYYYRQNEPAFSQKISDSYLTTLCVKSSGQNIQDNNLIAVGDMDGVVNMMELSDSLYNPLGKKEKDTVQVMFDREFRREKGIEVSKKLAEQKKAQKKEIKEKEGKEDKIKARIEAFELEFFKAIEDASKEPTEKKLEEPKIEQKIETEEAEPLAVETKQEDKKPNDESPTTKQEDIKGGQPEDTEANQEELKPVDNAENDLNGKSKELQENKKVDSPAVNESPDNEKKGDPPQAEPPKEETKE